MPAFLSWTCSPMVATTSVRSRISVMISSGISATSSPWPGPNGAPHRRTGSIAAGSPTKSAGEYDRVRPRAKLAKRRAQNLLPAGEPPDRGPMRRLSDHKEGKRTGHGRRARDRIIAGQTLLGEPIRERYELANLILFLTDDLRESALAVGGI